MNCTIFQPNPLPVMPRILYLMDGSAPCRAAWMALKAAGVDFEVKRVDLINGEQKEDWFVKVGVIFYVKKPQTPCV